MRVCWRGFLAGFALFAIAAPAAAVDPELDRLRVEYAQHFFSAEAHLRLAKHLADHGQQLAAFQVTEAARNVHFTAEQFDAAVRSVFREELPDTGALSEESLRSAAAAQPESFMPTKALAEFLREASRGDEADAMEQAWLDAHPESLEAWQAKAARVVEQDPESACALMLEALARFPDDASIHFHYAGLLYDLKQMIEAAVHFERAAALAPKSAYIQGWTARFFLRGMKDRDRALAYYYRAYFLDPDFADTEPAADRISALTTERATEVWGKERKNPETIEAGLRSRDPALVRLALDAAGNVWSRRYAVALVNLMYHDDPELRRGAAELIGLTVTRAAEVWLKRTVAGHVLTMVEHGAKTPGQQAYLRSAAAYVAGIRFRYTVVPLLESWLTDPVELMRYDAVAVLAQYGGAHGHARLRKLWRAGTVSDPRIRVTLEEMFAKK